MRKNLIWLAVVLVLLSQRNADAQTQLAGSYAQKVRTFHTQAEFTKLTHGAVKIQRSSKYRKFELPPNAAGKAQPLFYLVDKDTQTKWLVLQQGVYRAQSLAPAGEYFGGQRWLPSDNVKGIGFEKNAKQISGVWFETDAGYSRVEYKPMTLAEKSASFVERIRARHVRHGLSSDSLLQTPGELKTNRTVSSDNDGLWTAMYVAAECFRYKVTGDAQAREYARIGMQALLRLEEITGIPGFPARSFIKQGEDIQPNDGEWHDTPDGVWRWKGDTSSDEIVGHYFVYPIYYDLVADEAEKKTLAATLDRITNHILDHDYQLIDVDGKATRWGWWGPEAIWVDPDELGLRALHLLAHLRSAMHVSQSETLRTKYQKHYDELINKHRYHLLTRNQKINIPGRVNHSDDELAFLSYYPLLQYETDEKLRKVYQESLERAWLIERPERNPLWNFIYAVGCTANEYDQAASVRTLQEIPLDTIEWTMKNSHRLDVPLDNYADRQGRQQGLTVLPYSELPMHKWNGNPYNLDGGNGGRSEDDGAYFLLPYWLGRYHKLVGE